MAELKNFTVKPSDLYDWYIDPLLMTTESEKQQIKYALIRAYNLGAKNKVNNTFNEIKD